jgi:hypothetical protein
MQNIVMLTQVKGMPQMPPRPEQPAEAIGNAVKAMRIGTGEEAEGLGADDSKEKATQLLRRCGGKVRAEALSPLWRAEIAKKQPPEDGPSTSDGLVRFRATHHHHVGNPDFP